MSIQRQSFTAQAAVRLLESAGPKFLTDWSVNGRFVGFLHPGENGTSLTSLLQTSPTRLEMTIRSGFGQAITASMAVNSRQPEALTAYHDGLPTFQLKPVKTKSMYEISQSAITSDLFRAEEDGSLIGAMTERSCSI
jgi:hypothetical protein